MVLLVKVRLWKSRKYGRKRCRFMCGCLSLASWTKPACLAYVSSARRAKLFLLFIVKRATKHGCAPEKFKLNIDRTTVQNLQMKILLHFLRFRVFAWCPLWPSVTHAPFQQRENDQTWFGNISKFQLILLPLIMVQRTCVWLPLLSHGVVLKGLLTFLGSLYKEVAKTTPGT